MRRFADICATWAPPPRPGDRAQNDPSVLRCSELKAWCTRIADLARPRYRKLVRSATTWPSPSCRSESPQADLGELAAVDALSERVGVPVEYVLEIQHIAAWL